MEAKKRDMLVKFFIVAVSIVVIVLLANSLLSPKMLGESTPQILSPAIELCADGIQDQDESDVDCGGKCTPCGGGLGCSENANCGYRMGCDGGVCRELQWHTDRCEPLFSDHNNPIAENVNIVFAGIGYDSKEDFFKDARRASGYDSLGEIYPGLLFYEPMRTFRDTINLWYIDRIGNLQNTTGDCRERCQSTLGEEYCPKFNRQVIYLCNAKCDMSTERGGDIYVGKSNYQSYEVVHGFGHSYGFLPDTKDESIMGNYLRLSARMADANDFLPEHRAQIAERFGRHRGTAFTPWYMLWIVFDEEFNIVDAWENPHSIGETRRLPAPYILRMNAGALSYVFDFDAVRTTITDTFSPRSFSAREEPKQFIVVPLPLKVSNLSDDKLKLNGYKGTVEPYTLDIVSPQGDVVKRLPAEDLAKFLQK